MCVNVSHFASQGLCSLLSLPPSLPHCNSLPVDFFDRGVKRTRGEDSSDSDDETPPSQSSHVDSEHLMPVCMSCSLSLSSVPSPLSHLPVIAPYVLLWGCIGVDKRDLDAAKGAPSVAAKFHEKSDDGEKRLR